MLKKLVFIVLFLIPIVLFGQINKTENLHKLCEVWGFLKYYHPAVMQGKYDWDEELFKMIDKMDALRTGEEGEHLLLAWIRSMGDVGQREPLQIKDSTKYAVYPDYEWIETDCKNKELKDELIKIKDCKRDLPSHYVTLLPYEHNATFRNEKSINDIDYSNEKHKLLFLFRFWNAINYYFPYKHLTNKDWNDVLREYIPKFLEAKTKFELHQNFAQLTAEINDSHCIVKGDENLCYEGVFRKYNVPVHLSIVDNKVIMSGIFEKYRDSIVDLKIGDEILAVDGIPLENLIRKKLKFIPMSNYNSADNVTDKLLCSDDEDIVLDVVRERKKIKISTKGYRGVRFYEPKSCKYKMLGDSILYVWTEGCKRMDVIGIASLLNSTKGLILDLRGYPGGIWYTLGNFLMPKPTLFAYWYKPVLKYPGLFERYEAERVGSMNPNYYKGKIVLLVNQVSISHAEATTMAWQVAPNVTTIGSQTAGANGNLSQIVMPDGLVVRFSGLGVCYPDYSETQRVGVRVDEEVRNTYEDIVNGRDRVLERAIELINKN